jgi:hypothetical protein
MKLNKYFFFNYRSTLSSKFTQFTTIFILKNNFTRKFFSRNLKPSKAIRNSTYKEIKKNKEINQVKLNTVVKESEKNTSIKNFTINEEIHKLSVLIENQKLTDNEIHKFINVLGRKTLPTLLEYSNQCDKTNVVHDYQKLQVQRHLINQKNENIDEDIVLKSKEIDGEFHDFTKIYFEKYPEINTLLSTFSELETDDQAKLIYSRGFINIEEILVNKMKKDSKIEIYQIPDSKFSTNLISKKLEVEKYDKSIDLGSKQEISHTRNELFSSISKKKGKK